MVRSLGFPQNRQRPLLLVSLALGLIALGLAWTGAETSPGISVWYAVPGYATPARVFVVAALLATMLALRTGSDGLMRAALFLAAAGWAIQPGAGAGQVVYLAALVLLATAVRMGLDGESGNTAPAR